MAKGSMMNAVKIAAGGMLAGVVVGAAGKAMIDSKPKMRKKANRAIHTVGQIIDTAQYMFR